MKENLLEMAGAIGNKLCRDALWHEERCTWAGWSMEFDGVRPGRAFVTAGYDIYSGTAGIALFLASLVDQTGDALQRRTLNGAINHVMHSLDRDENGDLSLYSGRTGAAFVLQQVADKLESERLAEVALTIVDDLSARDYSESPNDVLSGIAGIIPVLIGFGRRYDRPRYLEKAGELGRILVERATRSDRGWSWGMGGNDAGEHLLGYSHGAGGIAAALAELYAVEQSDDVLAAVRGALQYERSHYSDSAHNWPDLRSFPGNVEKPQGPTFMSAWCHGAPGIALSRIRIFELLGQGFDPQLHEEIGIALETTRASIAGNGNLSLCHGDGGNADVLVAGALVFPEMNFNKEIELVAGRAHDLFEARADWPCGVQDAGECPGLMLGLAGIGYSFLRMALAEEHMTPLLIRSSDITQTDGALA